MAGKKQQQMGSSSNSSSFTNDLFGPKDPPPSTVFGSVFGPPSSARKQDFGGNYDNVKQGISGNNTDRGKGENSESTIKNKNNNKYNSQTVEPSYLGSSIYYRAQEVCSPTSQTNASQSAGYIIKCSSVQGRRNTCDFTLSGTGFKRDGKNDDDLNGPENASRGDWWQGSLYY